MFHWSIFFHFWNIVFQTGTSGGTAVGLNLKTLLYIGGVDLFNIMVAKSVGVKTGFNGCISKVSSQRSLYNYELI